MKGNEIPQQKKPFCTKCLVVTIIGLGLIFSIVVGFLVYSV